MQAAFDSLEAFYACLAPVPSWSCNPWAFPPLEAQSGVFPVLGGTGPVLRGGKEGQALWPGVADGGRWR